MRKLLVGLLVVLLLSIGLSGIGFAEEEKVLNMYFSAAEDWGALLAEKFEEYAGCRVDWIRMSSAETYARIKNPVARPQGMKSVKALTASLTHIFLLHCLANRPKFSSSYFILSLRDRMPLSWPCSKTTGNHQVES